MSIICKFCTAEITWTKRGDESVPLNLDGSDHLCQAGKGKKTSAVKDEFRTGVLVDISKGLLTINEGGKEKGIAISTAQFTELEDNKLPANVKFKVDAKSFLTKLEFVGGDLPLGDNEFAKAADAKKKAIAEAAAVPAAKEVAQADARTKENEAYAQKEAIAAYSAGRIPTQAPQETDTLAVSTGNLHLAGQGVDLTLKPQQTPLIVDGAVKLAVHIDLGSYSNFDLEVNAASGEHARALLEQEAKPVIALCKRIMREAKEGY